MGVEFSVYVRVVDQSLDLVGEEVTLSINKHSFADGSTEVTGTILTTDGVMGVEFPGLRIDVVDEDYRLTAGGPGFEDVDSARFAMRCDSTEGDFHFGDGSSDNPFGICTIEDLYRLNDAEAGQHYLLVRTLQLTDPHQPFGTFQASLDGGGHGITGVHIIDGNPNAAGFFESIGENGRVTDLHLEILSLELDGEPQANGAYGGLAGTNHGDLRRCSADVQLSVGEGRVGGLVGYSQAPIRDSSTSGTVIGGGHTGGLVGEAEATITGSHSTADVSQVGTSSVELSSLGGLVGLSNDGGIRESWSSGTVMTTGTVDRIGGLTGRCRGNEGELVDSYSTSPVEGTAEQCGGLAAFVFCPVRRSHATGDVTCRGSIAGGLIAFTNWGNEDSHATGDVTIECDEDCDDTVAGGLIGVLRHVGGTADRPTIRRTSAEGTVSGAYFSGGLVGQLGDPGTNSFGALIEMSFASGDVTGLHRAGGLVGQSTRNSVISDSYATGAVAVDEGGTAGGLVGEAPETSNESTSIMRTYAASPLSCVDGSCTLRSLLDGQTAEDSYWDSELAPPGAAGPGEPLPTDEFRHESSFPGWDFTAVWIIPPEGEMDSPRRPRLRWEN